MAKVKRLVFADTDEGRQHFQFLSDGILIGSLQWRSQQRDREELSRNAKTRTRLEARIQRKVMAISTPTISPALHRPQDCARELLAGEQLLDLTAEELEHVEKLITAVPWGGAQQIPVADLYDFLAMAPEVEPCQQN